MRDKHYYLSLSTGRGTTNSYRANTHTNKQTYNLTTLLPSSLASLVTRGIFFYFQFKSRVNGRCPRLPKSERSRGREFESCGSMAATPHLLQDSQWSTLSDPTYHDLANKPYSVGMIFLNKWAIQEASFYKQGMAGILNKGILILIFS